MFFSLLRILHLPSPLTIMINTALDGVKRKGSFLGGVESRPPLSHRHASNSLLWSPFHGPLNLTAQVVPPNWPRTTACPPYPLSSWWSLLPSTLTILGWGHGISVMDCKYSAGGERKVRTPAHILPPHYWESYSRGMSQLDPSFESSRRPGFEERGM